MPKQSSIAGVFRIYMVSFLMVYFHKRLKPEVLGEVNEMILWGMKEWQANEVESKG